MNLIQIILLASISRSCHRLTETIVLDRNQPMRPLDLIKTINADCRVAVEEDIYSYFMRDSEMMS